METLTQMNGIVTEYSRTIKIPLYRLAFKKDAVVYLRRLSKPRCSFNFSLILDRQLFDSHDE